MLTDTAETTYSSAVISTTVQSSDSNCIMLFAIADLKVRMV